MSKTIQHKRSSVAGNQPDNTQVAVGELGINFPDRSIYTKDGSGVITELARDVWRTDTAPDSALDGDMWYNTSTGEINIWDGTDWNNIGTETGQPVDPGNITSEPAFIEGTGDSSDPYIFETVYANVGDVNLHVANLRITGLNDGQIVEMQDFNSATNGGRYKASNNIADPSGVLNLRVSFDDAPTTLNSTTYSGELKIGGNSIYINGDVVVAQKLDGNTEVPSGVPDGTGGSGPFIWQGGDTTLTATYPLLVSDNGYYFTDQITISNGDEFWLKWAGEPGSGDGIDEPHGTTIRGALVDGFGGAQYFYFTIDKETSFVFHNFVDSDQTLGGQSESRKVTVRDVNSYVYPFGTTTGDSAQYAKNGGDWTDIPSTNTGSATHYMVEGDEFQLRHRDAATINTASTYNFNMAGDSADWTTVTADVLPTIKQPTIEAPDDDDATGISTTGPFVSSDFEMASGTDSHTASSWEIIGGLQWVPKDIGITKHIYKVIWNGTQYLAIGTNGACVTSPDGVTWTNQPGLASVISGKFYSVAWNGTLYCAVGDYAYSATSPDGVTWTRQDDLSIKMPGVNFKGIAWNGSLFCAVGVNSKGAATSPDGVTWTKEQNLNTVGGNITMYDIAWHQQKNVFIVSAEGGRLFVSSNGASWTYHGNHKSAAGSSTKMYSISTDGPVIMTIGENGTCCTSTNLSVSASTWTKQPDFISATGSGDMRSVVWNGSQYIAVGRGGISATSPDGVTWTSQSGLSGNLNTVTSNGSEQVVTLGDANTGITIFASLEEGIFEESLNDTSNLESWSPSTPLDYKKDYKVRVKHHTATLNSEWSDARSFETKNPNGASSERWNYHNQLSSEISYGASGTASEWRYYPSIDALMLYQEQGATVYNAEGPLISTDGGITFSRRGSLIAGYSGGWRKLEISDAGHVYLEVNVGDSRHIMHKSNETVSSVNDLSNLTWTEQTKYASEYDYVWNNGGKKGYLRDFSLKGNTGVVVLPSENHIMYSSDLANDVWNYKYLGTVRMYVQHSTHGPSEGDFIVHDNVCTYVYRHLSGQGYSSWSNIASTLKSSLGVSNILGIKYLDSANVLGILYRAGSEIKFATSTDFGNTWTEQTDFNTKLKSVSGWSTSMAASQSNPITTTDSFVYHSIDTNTGKVPFLTSPDGVTWYIGSGAQSTFTGLGPTLTFGSSKQTIIGAYSVGSGGSATYQVYTSDI